MGTDEETEYKIDKANIEAEGFEELNQLDKRQYDNFIEEMIDN